MQPLWALLRIVDRARYMHRMAQAIVDEFDALTETIAREQGRPRAEVATMELLSTNRRTQVDRRTRAQTYSENDAYDRIAR